MQLFLALLATCALALGGKIPQLDDRIIGGQDVDIREHPHQISLRRAGGHWCGGSIINENTILTAAHCVHGSDPKIYAVRVGNSIHNEGELYEIESITEHPRYNPNTAANDACIIKLRRPITLSATAQIIKLQDSEDEVPAGTSAIVTGWGTTISGFPAYPKHLRGVDVNVISQFECKEAYAGTAAITSSMLCARKRGQDSCQGDSGGPLVANGRLIGIVSWGLGCADPNYPGVYAKVSSPSIRNFIDQHW